MCRYFEIKHINLQRYVFRLIVGESARDVLIATVDVYLRTSLLERQSNRLRKIHRHTAFQRQSTYVCAVHIYYRHHVEMIFSWIYWTFIFDKRKLQCCLNLQFLCFIVLINDLIVEKNLSPWFRKKKKHSQSSAWNHVELFMLLSKCRLKKCFNCFWLVCTTLAFFGTQFIVENKQRS